MTNQVRIFRKTATALAIVISIGVVTSLTASEALAERQPNMRTALEYLQSAEAELMRASHDKGGHRVRSLKHVRIAIAEVRRGIRFDRLH
jgi:hypothetical protein